MSDDQKQFWYTWDDDGFFCLYKRTDLPISDLILTWPGDPGTDDEELVKKAIDKLNSFEKDYELIRVESYADNGAFSHYDIVNKNTGERIFGTI